jgi:hypothetical protein
LFLSIKFLDSSNITCNLNGEFYPHNAEWKLSPCTQCKCDMGQIVCNRIECEMLSCDVNELVPGQCCPVCTGECRSSIGSVVSSGEKWTEDNDCTHCVCINGSKSCTSESCARLGCSNPVKKPGQCCPICESSSNIGEFFFLMKLKLIIKSLKSNPVLLDLKMLTLRTNSSNTRHIASKSSRKPS